MQVGRQRKNMRKCKEKPNMQDATVQESKGKTLIVTGLAAPEQESSFNRTLL